MRESRTGLRISTRSSRREFTVIALTPGASALDLGSFARQGEQKIAVLVGTEGLGLSERVVAMADVHLRIPIRQEVDSLNLATATGIALYHVTSQRSAKAAPLGP